MRETNNLKYEKVFIKIYIYVNMHDNTGLLTLRSGCKKPLFDIAFNKYLSFRNIIMFCSNVQHR